MLKTNARYVVLALATNLTLVSGCASAMDADGEMKAAEIIKQLNREQQEALLLNKDPEPIQRIALDNFLVIAPGGRVENKSQAVAGVDSLDVRGVEISQEQVIFHGDTAVLVGKLDIDGTMAPLGKLPPMKFMATYVKTDDGWRMLSRSMTPCAPVAVERGVC